MQRVHLGGARQAPARPENDEHDVAPGRGQVERLAVELGPPDRGSRLADQVEPLQSAGEIRLEGGTIGVLEEHIEGFPGDVIPAALDQPLIVGVAQAHHLVGRQLGAGPTVLGDVLRDGHGRVQAGQ